MMQNHAEKQDIHKQLILQMKQENVENLENCAAELDREKALVKSLEAAVRDLEEKVRFSQQREIEHVKHIRTLQDELQTLEGRLKAVDG